MSSYEVMKKRHQDEVNALPLAFAFSNEQFAKGMALLGLKPEDADKVYGLGIGGAFYRCEDSKLIRGTFDRHEKEMQDAIDTDKTGGGFIYQMFAYELRNHEYGYTRDFESTLDALGLEQKDFEKSEPLRVGLSKAAKEIREEEAAS